MAKLDEKDSWKLPGTSHSKQQADADELLSMQVAMQLQEEEKKRAERHKRRNEEYVRQLMLQQ